MLAGLALVFAAASPLSGVSPRGGSAAALTPAQQQVGVLAAGEFALEPLGKVMPPTAYPEPGVRGGPTMSVKVTNITGVPLKLSVRLPSIAPSLDSISKVRASVAGAVVLNTTLAKAAEWSKPAGVLEAGQQSTLRLRFKLLPGSPADAYLGHLDVRELQVKGIKMDGDAATNTVVTVIPDRTTPTGGAPASTPQAPPLPSSTPPATTPDPDGTITQEGRIPEGGNPQIDGDS